MNQLNQVLSRIFSRSQRLSQSLRLVQWQTLAITVPSLSSLCLLKSLKDKNKLSHFLEKEHILFKNQFGFRKNYSTERAILELTMKLYAVFFLTYLKPLILSTIRSYYRNYTDTESVVSLCSGWKAILKAEHVSMLNLKMLNQTQFQSNVVYHKGLPLAHFCFWYISMTWPIV